MRLFTITSYNITMGRSIRAQKIIFPWPVLFKFLFCILLVVKINFVYMLLKKVLWR